MFSDYKHGHELPDFHRVLKTASPAYGAVCWSPEGEGASVPSPRRQES